jgi:phosphoribosylformylglycinamidine (FGAM) synthase-like enzyme
MGRLRAGELAPHDYRAFRNDLRFLVKAAGEGAVTAVHDISDGGLLTALVELCATGANVNLEKLLPDCYDDEDHNRLATLFSEEGHRWLLAVSKQQRGWLRTAALHYQVGLTQLGTTVDGKLEVACGSEHWLECEHQPLRRILRYGLIDALEG